MLAAVFSLLCKDADTESDDADEDEEDPHLEWDESYMRYTQGIYLKGSWNSSQTWAYFMLKGETSIISKVFFLLIIVPEINKKPFERILATVKSLREDLLL